jgi:hypothetical protein
MINGNVDLNYYQYCEAQFKTEIKSEARGKVKIS